MKLLLTILLFFTQLGIAYAGLRENCFAMVDSAYQEAMAGNYQTAVNINNEGLAMLPQDSLALRCEFYSCLLYCYHRLGDYQQALHYGELCLEYDEQTESLTNISASLGNLAGIYSSAGQYNTAISYLRRAINIEEELLKADKEHTPKSLAIRKAMLGEVLLAKYKEQKADNKQTDLLFQALQLTEEALEIDRTLNRVLQESMRLSQLANIYSELGNKNELQRCNREALIIARETGNKATEVITLLQLGNYAEAANIAHTLGMKKQEEQAFMQLSQTSHAKGNYKDAFYYLQQAVALRDNIRKEETDKQLILWQVKYDTQRKEQEITRQKTELQRKQSEKMWLIAIIAMSLFALLLALINVWLLARRKKEIENIAQQKDRHYTILSHDLKNPMLAQQQILRILNRDFDLYSQSELHNNITKLLAGSDSQLELLYNLQEVALLEIGKRQTSQVRFDVAPMLHEMAESMHNIAKQKNLSFEFLTERQLVMADRENIKTIIRNLLSNAIKFSYDGSVIRLGTTAPDKFYISDSGIGMTPDRQKLLLESDKPIPSFNGTRGESGTGIGMLICRELLRLNNGTLSVDSESGKGTTFTIKLPV